MNFLHYFHPQPILFKLGPLTFHWYGLIIAGGLFFAFLISNYFAKRLKKNDDDIYSLTIWLIIGGIIGARLYDFLIVEFSYFIKHPLDIFKIWQGGLAIHGAIIGGFLSLLIWCKIKNQKLFDWLDLITVSLPLGQAIGRFGNYFNQELFGGPTNLPWGIPIDIEHRPLQYLTSSYFHPAFLYESIMNLFLFLFLFFLMKKNKLPIGAITAIYFIGYGLIRFIMEFIRIDETTIIFGCRLPQLVSCLMFISGWIFLCLLLIKNKKNKTTSL